MTRRWSPAAISKLKRLFPILSAPQLAKALKRSRSAIDNMTHKLGLRKSEAFLKRHQFKKGMVPWNRGVTGYMGANRTSFKKGQMPVNHKPIGSERVTKDGYLERKIADPRKWKPVHVINWEKKHGKVKRGWIVVFKPGANKLDPAVENLECISRAENMRRNTYHRYPKEIARLIQLRGALNRQINRREREEQDSGLTRSSIRGNRKGEGRGHAARPGEGGGGRSPSHYQQRQGRDGLSKGARQAKGNGIYPRGRARYSSAAEAH